MADEYARMTAEGKIQEISEAQVRRQKNGPLLLGKVKNFLIAFAPQTMVADVQNLESPVLQNPGGCPGQVFVHHEFEHLNRSP